MALNVNRDSFAGRYYMKPDPDEQTIHETQMIPLNLIEPVHEPTDTNKVVSMIAVLDLGDNRLPPLLVAPNEFDEGYQAYSGAHRYAAHEHVGSKFIECYVMDALTQEVADHEFQRSNYWYACEELGHYEQNGCMLASDQPVFWEYVTRELLNGNTENTDITLEVREY